MSGNFADRLLEAVARKANPSVIGLDTDFSQLPPALVAKHAPAGAAGGAAALEAAAAAVIEFNERILTSIADVVPAVKLQIAFYEQLGAPGIAAYAEAARRARELGLIVIADAKRNDVGNTSAAYARAFLGRTELFGRSEPVFDVDALTVNAYLGSDGVAPFAEEAVRYGKGLFILVKTSNPGSGELQDLESGGRPIYERMAELVKSWGSRPGLTGASGWSSIGAVVGATWPRQAARLRELMPAAPFLVPGYGSQGAGADDALPCFDADGRGALVHSARAVIFAWQKRGLEDWAGAAREAALAMRAELTGSLRKSGRWK